MAVIAGFQNNPPFPIYAVPYTVVFPMLDADGDPVTGETCDSERSLDGDTGADCTNEGTEITFTTATNKGMYYLTLTAAEMTSVITIVTVYAANSKATPIVLYPKALPPLADTTATAGAAGTITLAVGSSALDDYYAGCYIYLDGGTGSGQGRMITSYVGSTRVATIKPNWGTNPDDTSEYIIYRTEYALLNDGNLDAAVSAIPTTAMRGTDNVVLAGPTKTEMDNAIATIIADTEDLQGNVDAMHDTDLPAVKSETALIVADTNELQGLIASSKIAAQVKGTDDIDLSATMKTSVNAEVVDALGTDTLAELGVAAPAATPTIKAALMLLYMALRNKIDVDADWKEIHNDAGTVICKKALTDDATTYSEAEAESG